MDDDTLGELLEHLCRTFLVPGAQAVVEGPGRSAMAFAGVERRTNGAPVTPGSAFPVGSLTKPLTATLAMLLVGDGEIELDAPVQEYLPEFGFGEPAPGVTLRRLLCHSAGMPANVEEEGGAARSDAGAGPGLRRRWVRDHTSSAERPFPPGRVFSYANSGYVVVGRLIESVVGMTWAEAMEALLLAPLGIRFTEICGTASTAAGRRHPVPGHVRRREDGHVVEVAELLPRIEEPGGALALSALDLARYATLFHVGAGDPTVLPALLAAQMCSDQMAGLAAGPFGLANGWGLGWARYAGAVSATEFYGHDGTGEGTSCHLRFDPLDGTTVALTTNAATGVDLWLALAEELQKDGLGLAEHAATVLADPAPALELPAEWLGGYANGQAALMVDSDGQGAQLLLGRQPWARLEVGEDLRFRALARSGGRQVGRFLRIAGEQDERHLQLSGRLARKC